MSQYKYPVSSLTDYLPTVPPGMRIGFMHKAEEDEEASESPPVGSRGEESLLRKRSGMPGRESSGTRCTEFQRDGKLFASKTPHTLAEWHRIADAYCDSNRCKKSEKKDPGGQPG